MPVAVTFLWEPQIKIKYSIQFSIQFGYLNEFWFADAQILDTGG